MVATRGMTGGTRPKVKPLPAKPSEAEKAAKAAKAARMKTEKEEKKVARDAAKRLKDAEKAAAKADKDASKAAAKAAKVAKVANAKNSTKGTKRTIDANTKAAKATKATKATKAIKTTKAAEKTKATKGGARAPNETASPDQSDEDEDEDEESEESEEDHDEEPRAKRRRVETLPSPDLSVRIGPPKVNRPVIQIGNWEYMRKTDIPEGVESESNRPLPDIYIGGAAPHPRWVVTRIERLKVPSEPSVILDFGGLQWTFEEGDFKKWTGLEYTALFELAYMCLEHTLIDTEVREHIYKSLAQGPLPEAETAGYNWYPALPPVPFTRHFGTGSSQQSSRRPSDAFYFNNFDRPNMAVRPRNDHMPQPYLPHMPSIVSNHPRLEEWPTASRSASPDPESERGSNESQPGDSRRSSVTRESDLELNPEGTYSEPTTPVPLEDDGKSAPNGEYKCT
ncbi:hypothetical protein ACN38_g9414 [Penicillium nordicum]|uniref:Uncharacterized protein n=1 Tax=Penicillium nordicum TaxID=229535 RepID=A0A0M8NUK6_9EURO|nr:hypothetical protein ACN38_g9414 [Penicillium nordicum]